MKKTVWEVASYLSMLVQDRRHAYLDSLPQPAAEPFLEGFHLVLGTQQVTDVYLLTLAASCNAKLVTFDTRLDSLDSSGRHVQVLRA